MELTQISKHVYISDFEEYRDRPRLGYINGSQRAVLIDAGASKEHLFEVLDLIKKKGLHEPEVVILTHWHWDHVYGLHACDFPALCSDKTQLKLKEMADWKWDEASMAKRIKSGEDILFCDEHIRHEYSDLMQIKVVEADETFFDEYELDCGDVNLSIFEMETDHSDDSTFIYVKEDKVLFVGDAYSKDYHHGEPHYTKEKLNKLIEMIKKLDINLIIHGHDEVLKKEELLENLKLELFQLN